MKNNSITNQKFAALANGLPVPLTVTMEGTGSATAWITGNKIIVDLVAAQTGKYVNISTPIEFDVIGAHTIHGNATASTVQIANTTDAITSAIAMAAVDTDIDNPTTLDDAYWSFATGDNDLRLIIGTAAATGRLVIDIDK
ncbi:MAG: hypothetical protein HQ534_11320 [Armatimonadetes bacterium]|nr:hypothetical protein [Armatimonadota bacterium]